MDTPVIFKKFSIRSQGFIAVCQSPLSTREMILVVLNCDIQNQPIAMVILVDVNCYECSLQTSLVQETRSLLLGSFIPFHLNVNT